MLSTYTFRSPSESNPCPICTGTTARCRITDGGTVFCGNLSESESVGAAYSRDGSAKGFWQKFAPASKVAGDQVG